MQYEKLIRGCVKAPALCITIVLLAGGCKKEKIAPPPVPLISLVETGYVISDTSPEFVAIEIEASEYVEAYDFPVYFQLEGTAQANVHFTTEHPVYTNSEGVEFYKAVMAQGSRKGAVMIKPLNKAEGNKTLTIKFFPDQENDRYTLVSPALTATLEISDN